MCRSNYFPELEQMSDDPELKKLAQKDLEKLSLTLDDLMSDASRIFLPGRNFDSSNSLLEVYAGKIRHVIFHLF